jgi:hypothetical protein
LWGNEVRVFARVRCLLFYSDGVRRLRHGDAGTEARVVPVVYERLPDFPQLARRYDPEGKFGNAFLDTYVV